MNARFKLQKMESGAPSIVISKNGIFLSKNLYRKMKGTRFVQLYLAEDSKELAIVPCSYSDEAAVELKIVNDYARVYNKDFICKLAVLIGKSFDEIKWTVLGRPEEDYFVFDLKTGKAGKTIKEV